MVLSFLGHVTSVSQTRPDGLDTTRRPELHYGSEGWGFESLRARPAQRPLSSSDHDLAGWVDDVATSIQPAARLMSTPSSCRSHSGLRAELLDRRFRDWAWKLPSNC